MRQLKKQITVLVIGGVALLTLSLMLVFYFQLESAVLKGAETKARADLDTTEAIFDLKYPGPWNVQDGELFKGKTNINNNFVIVDDIKNLTGDTCVIFHKNICVSTTVPEGDCNRAIGIYAPYEVTSKVLEVGQYYTGCAELAGKSHYTAYKPIKNQFGEVIGVLYVGVPASPYVTIFSASMKMTALVGTILALLIGLGASILAIWKLNRPLGNGVPEVATNKSGKSIRTQSGNENGELAQEYHHILVEDQISSGKLETVAAVARHQGAEEATNCPPVQEQRNSGNEEDENIWLDELLVAQKTLPKGLNRVTLKQIALFLRQQDGNEITIQDVSEAVCLSRVTVRHYFDYLNECGLVEMEQKYGSVGRPLRIYKSKL